MKKVALLVAGLVLFSIPLFAGEYLMNDTGDTVYGLRVVFSESVKITGFGDVLNTVEPTRKATEFIFSGSALDAWGGHWFNWEPAPASLVNHEWLTDPALVAITAEAVETGQSDVDLPLWMRNPHLTYKEIMAEIAKCPGPDEPLYVPAGDEAVWLTDLEGHADIYNNDSIKINYADWFDQSQITKIEVYRNGIKMRFLPDTFDVLTNEQMKTFDGNPFERTPASNHTDHAIFGYGYEFRIYRESNSYVSAETATIRSPFHFSGERVVNIGIATDISGWPESRLVEVFRKYPKMGFDTIQFQVYYFMHSGKDDELFALQSVNKRIHPWARTLSESEIRKLLRVADTVGLNAEMRVEIWISEETQASDCLNNRSSLAPQDIEKWFQNYTAICVSLGQILEEEGGDVFTPVTELSTI
jgi:hypothetical protein